MKEDTKSQKRGGLGSLRSLEITKNRRIHKRHTSFY